MVQYPIRIFLIFLTIDCVFHNKNFVTGLSNNPLLTFDKLYSDGIEYYLENNFGNCQKYIELAIEDFHWRNKVIIK